MNTSKLNHTFLNATFLNGARELLASSGGGVKWETVTVSGESTIHLTDAKANSISSLVLYGYCVQSDTPTPSAPKDIKTPAGFLSFKNGELPSGYARLQGITYGADTYYVIDGFRLKGSDTLRVSFTANKACNLIGCYTTAEAEDNYDIYLSTTANSKYLRYNGGAYLSTVEVGERYDVVVTPTGCTGFEKKSTWVKKSFTASVDMVVGSTSVNATSSKFDGIIHGDVIVDGRLHLVPCVRLSDNVVGYYDTIGKKFYAPTVGAGVAGEYDKSQITLDTMTQDIIRVYESAMFPNKPHFEVSVTPLLGIGNYLDKYDLISGNVERNVGYYIFTGEESFSKSSSYGTALYMSGQASKWGANKSATVLCSHFLGKPTASSSMAANTCFFNSSGHFYFRTDMTADAFKAFLAQQYAAGTPVVVVYALSSADMAVLPSVSVSNIKGNNVVERTSLIPSLPFEVTYKKEIKQSSGGGISFTINDAPYQAQEGMTWRQWVESDYNTGGFYLDFWGIGGGGEYHVTEEYITDGSGSGWFSDAVFKQDADLVNGYSEAPDDVIIADYPYILHGE